MPLPKTGLYMLTEAELEIIFDLVGKGKAGSSVVKSLKAQAQKGQPLPPLSVDEINKELDSYNTEVFVESRRLSPSQIALYDGSEKGKGHIGNFPAHTSAEMLKKVLSLTKSAFDQGCEKGRDLQAKDIRVALRLEHG